MGIEGIEPQAKRRLIELSGGIENIAFITLQGLDTGSDVDVYCVIHEGTSRVVIEEVQGVWHEYFIDTWAGMLRKLTNRDEIVRNFICAMPLRYSDGESHSKAVSHIPERFELPTWRRQLLYYRIKVIASKLSSSTNPRASLIFTGQLLPHLILAVFDSAGVWPSPPKQSAERIYSLDLPEARALISVLEGGAGIAELSQMYADRFTGIDMERTEDQNKLTYLG